MSAAGSIKDGSSCFSSPSPWKYDVFLSFRGEDTRKSFTHLLYTALVQARIHTFRDDDELPRGQEISLELLRAIKESRISIIVFSENYASSRWCLDELVKIIECKNTIGQLVFPIFYKIDPCDVHRQTGSFAEAFTGHEQRFKAEIGKVERWRAALTEAANLSGWDLQNVANGHELKFIQKIVERVLTHTYLNVVMHPVGIDSRVADINSLLSIGLDDVHMIGIVGIGGIGKTAIAKVVFNLISHCFDGCCFLANVNEVSRTNNGIVHLQVQLLSEILMKKNLKIGNADRGMNLIKDRLCHKRVLIVLDGLDKLSQLKTLAGNRDWFGLGSRIIITTRDEVLLYTIGVDEIYKAKELNHNESMQLFSRHAFREKNPSEDYVKLSNDIVSYAGGLPLVLEVLGSYLFERNLLDWKSAFEKLQQIPPNNIQEILRLSFDALEDDKLKDIFLDIACFFIGMDKDYVINILNGCGFFSEIGISDLTSRYLLTINEKNELGMHNLLRDMGREIICAESLKDPGKHSRLWFHEDIYHVLEKKKGTEAIEGVILDLPALKEVHTEAFARMKKLRLLQINNAHLTGSYEHLSKELRWLYWHYCPLRYLPSNFHLENMVVLDMQYSNVIQAWQDIKFIRNLKVLNLSHSKCLTKTPDFTGIPMLQKLLLEGCTSLFKVHPSIGILEKLVFLNMKDCKNMRNLPSSICKLKSLDHLNLIGCSNLEGLPEDLGNMKGLTELLADGTLIKQLPFSLGLLKNLTNLSLQGCNRNLPSKSWLALLTYWVQLRRCPNSIRFLTPSISGLSSLRRLVLSYCNLFEADIPVDIWSLASLEYLNLSGNSFCSLPSGLSHLSKLDTLCLDNCRSLQSIPELPPNLGTLDAGYCISLEKLSFPSNYKRLPVLYLSNCNSLAEIMGLENLDYVQLIHMENCSNLSNNLKDSFLKGQSELYKSSIYLPKKEIPDWFTFRRMGSSISFDIPLNVEHLFIGMTIWAVYAAKEDTDEFFYPPHAIISDRTNGVEWIDRPSNRAIPIILEEHTWVSHIPQSFLQYQHPVKGGKRMEVSIKVDPPLEVKKCGIYLAYKTDITDDNQRQFSCVNILYRDEIMDNVNFKRGNDINAVETNCDLSNKDKFPKRLRMEPDRTEI